MRLFIQRLLFFCLAFFAMLILVDAMAGSYLSSKADFRLDGTPEILILGNSHPECAFNDSLIPGAVNLAAPGETYYYTYFKLKSILDQNPSLRTVLLEAPNDWFIQKTDSLIWSTKYQKKILPQMGHFLDLNASLILARNNFNGFLQAKALLTRASFKRIIHSDNSYAEDLGGYLYLKRFKTDSLLGALEGQQKQRPSFIPSQENLEYLDKIVALCKEKDVALRLMRSPVHAEWPGRRFEASYQLIIRERYDEVELLDFMDHPMKNSDFADLGHLNHRGAERFSKWFASRLEEGMLERER